MRRALALALLTLAASVVPATADDFPVETRSFHCAGANGAVEAMENSYIAALGNGNCWGHLGHHTYDIGTVAKIGAMSGRVFTVEVQFSPPTEILVQPMEPPEIPPIPLPAIRAWTALTIEGSTSGVHWFELDQIPYQLNGATRQEIFFNAHGGDVRARFIRIRQPLSAAQGLSGYLDHSRFDADIRPLPLPVSAELGPKTYSCADHVMERMFDTHPCWFGGINRYDSPSAFHTYRVGTPAAVESISGSATFLPWRSDDYTQDGGSPTSLAAEVQTSIDGVAWDTLGTIAGAYGEPIAFSFDALDARAVSFVRIVAERHHGYTRHPALKHVRGFLIDSQVTVDAPLVV